MYLLTCLTCLSLVTSCVTSFDNQMNLNSFTFPAPVMTSSQQKNNSSNLKKANVATTVKLLPYEILAGTATSYADISFTISNTTEKDTELEVTKINFRFMR